MLLESKIAVIFGAGGSIGGSVARAFASAGATVYLSGRNLSPLELTATEIRSKGGKAKISIVDALDEMAVQSFFHEVMDEAGSIDICFNAIGLDDVQGLPITEMNLDDFTKPIAIAMQTQFLTSKYAGIQMQKQGSGVIMAITATPGGVAYPMVGGFGPACCAIEGFSRNLAAELGPYGVRVVCLRSAGSPDSEVFRRFLAEEKNLAKKRIQDLEDDTMLKKLPAMADIANVAVFMASDMAAGMTGTVANITCGTTRD